MDNRLGRVCTGCGHLQSWCRYNKKSNGLYGYDSRCKSCISKAKRLYKKKETKKYVETITLHSVVVGKPDKEKSDLVGRILATSIMTLIDEGIPCSVRFSDCRTWKWARDQNHKVRPQWRITWGRIWSKITNGGGGGNWTRVRKRSIARRYILSCCFSLMIQPPTTKSESSLPQFI